MVNKKAQIKIQQMIFMLVGVALFFILAGLFALMLILNNLNQSATDVAQEEAILLISRLAGSPEFSCGNSFQNGESSCVDFDKIMILKNSIDSYSGFWRVSGIRIERFLQEEQIDCTLGNYPNCRNINVYSRNLRGNNIENEISSFVLLCRKEALNDRTYDSCEVARFYLSFEEQRQ